MKEKIKNNNFLIIILIAYSLFSFGFVKKIGSFSIDGFKINNLLYLIAMVFIVELFIFKKRKINLKIFFIISLYTLYLLIKISIQSNTQSIYSISILIIPMLMLCNIHDVGENTFKKHIKILIVFNLVYSLFFICEFYFYNSIAGFMGLSKSADYVTRHSTMLGSSITTSYYFLMNIPLNFIGIIFFTKDLMWKRIAIIGIATTVLAIILGQSRIAFIILGIYFVIYFLLFGKKLKWNKKILIIIVFVCMMIWILNNKSLSRLYANYSESASTHARNSVMNTGLTLFNGNPIFGTEISKYYKRVWSVEKKSVMINGTTSLIDPHNMYIYILAEQGICGMIFFASIIVIVYLESIKYLPKNIKMNFYILLLGQGLAYYGGSQLINEINFSVIFWGYLVLISCLGLNERRKVYEKNNICSL